MKLAKLHSRFCTKRSLDFGTHIEANNVDLGILLFETLDWALTDWWCDSQYEGSVLLPSRSERIISWGAKAPISQDSLIGFKTTAVAPNNLQAINLFKQY